VIALAVALVALAPGVATLAYFYALDRHEPEPRRLVVRTFFAGMLAAVAAILAENVFDFGPEWVGALFLAPTIEEAAKFFAVRRTVYDDPEFDEPMDGIVYAAAAALGFASLENVLYLVQAANTHPESFTGMFFLRGLLSVPGHALNASMWGHALGWRKQVPALGRGFVLRGFGLAVVCHGLFNGFADMGWLGVAVLSFVFVPVQWAIVGRKVRRSLAESPHAVPAALSGREVGRLPRDGGADPGA
jgi:RsiW-degrading membrane proteinase PrsW (M82 family)